MNLSLIVAVSKNNVIGKNNRIPWVLRDDLKRFARLTKNHTVIMGRNTFYSILEINGGPLKDRRNLVLSDVPMPECAGYENVLVLKSWKEIFKELDKESETESFVIGGASVYKESIKFANKLYLTRVQADVEGDTYLSGFNKEDWVLVSEEKHYTDKRNEFDYNLLEYTRNDKQGYF